MSERRRFLTSAPCCLVPPRSTSRSSKHAAIVQPSRTTGGRAVDSADREATAEAMEVATTCPNLGCIGIRAILRPCDVSRRSEPSLAGAGRTSLEVAPARSRAPTPSSSSRARSKDAVGGGVSHGSDKTASSPKLDPHPPSCINKDARSASTISGGHCGTRRLSVHSCTAVPGATRPARPAR